MHQPTTTQQRLLHAEQRLRVVQHQLERVLHLIHQPANRADQLVSDWLDGLRGLLIGQTITARQELRYYQHQAELDTERHRHYLHCDGDHHPEEDQPRFRSENY